MTIGSRARLVAAVLIALAVMAPNVKTGTAASAQSGGVVLDGFGGLHPFGGFTLATTGAPYWQGWDIARATVVRDDGSGGWVLDGWGAIHAFGSAPAIQTPAWTPGSDSARDLAVTSVDANGLPNGASGYVLTGDGALHSWGGAPPLAGQLWPGQDFAEGLLVHFGQAGAGEVPDGAWVLRRDGIIENLGAAPPISLQDERVPPVWRHLHGNADGTVWALADWGVSAGAGASPTPPAGPETQSWNGYSDWGGWNILRDIHLSAVTAPPSATPASPGAVTAYRDVYRPRGGVTLDGYGGLHPFGGIALNSAGAAYWSGFDIARALVTMPTGLGGWTLDGVGGIHAFGLAPPPPGDAPYWPNWDIARDLVMTSQDGHGDLDGRQGYVLDAWGGVHAFGGAPALPNPAYWPGWDVARGLDVHLDGNGTPDGLLVMDAFGGLHYSGAYPAQTSPPYHPSQTYEHLQRTSDGHLYAVAHFGVAVDVGGQDVSTVPWPVSHVSPYWGGYGDWGVWDIVRDVALGRADNPAGGGQPVSWAASNALADRMTTLWTRYLNAPSIRQDMPLDCESAATAAALNMFGSGASQDWVFSQLPNDTRPAVMSNGVPVQWGDAWTSFVGNVFGSEQAFTGYGVYFSPIQSAIARAGAGAYGGQHWTLSDMMAEIDRGDPVIIWVSNTWQYTPTSTWTGFDGNVVPYTTTDHTVLLYGVDPGAQTISLMDVGTGTYRTFSWGQFSSFMATFANMALAVQ